MFVAPAVGLGILAVFLVGAWVTYMAVGLAGKQNPTGRVVNHDKWEKSENLKEKFALAGGALAVILLIFTLVTVQIRTAFLIWLGLTIVGVLFGLATFVFNEASRNKFNLQPRPPTGNTPPGQRAENRTSPPGAIPHRRAEEKPRSSPPTGASTGTPPKARPAEGKPSPSSGDSAGTREDYYRSLLAKAKYDQDLVDRLIESERKKTPLASWDDLCQNAIARLEKGEN